MIGEPPSDGVVHASDTVPLPPVAVRTGAPGGSVTGVSVTVFDEPDVPALLVAVTR